MFNPHNHINTLVSLTDEDRELTYKRTAEIAQRLDGIRRKLELPPESIAPLMTLHIQSIESVVADAHDRAQRERMERLPMKIRSNDRIKAGRRVDVVTRPQWVAYRIDAIEIEGTPANWKVHEIRVGNRAQSLQQDGPFSGELFRKDGPMDAIRLETLQTAMDFVMSVEYVGPSLDGEVFEATTIGIAATW